MDGAMIAAQRAVAISRLLAKDPSLQTVAATMPEALEFPSTDGHSFGLIINTGVLRSTLSLNLLWQVTIPVILRLWREHQLDGFIWVTAQAVDPYPRAEYQRFLSVDATVSDIGRMPSNGPKDLLNDSLWDKNAFQLRWYWPKQDIPLE